MIHDPEFSARPQKKRISRRVKALRWLLWAQVVAACYAAILSIADTRGIYPDHFPYPLDLIFGIPLGLSVVSCPLFPLVVIVVAIDSSMERVREIRALVATLALFWFHVFALFPGYQ